MADTVTAPPAPTQDLSRTPTLLETLAGQVDVTDAPRITGRTLPPIVEPDERTPKPKEEKKDEKPDKPKGETPPEKKEEKKDEDLQDEWRKAGETVAEKLFSKKGKKAEKTEDKPKEEDKPKAETTETTDKPKPDDEKPVRRRKQPIDESAVTERAAAAAAKAATEAVSKQLKKDSAADKPPAAKKPEDNLSAAERRQFEVYQELETVVNPERYKGVTGKYIKSLDELADYIKTWEKENQGQKFNPEDEAHSTFFDRIEPDVDEDDWVDAKASIRARQISEKQLAPVNEKLQQMEMERARKELEPFIKDKQLEATHLLLENFDSDLAAAIRKPEGLKALIEDDPITAEILNKTAETLGSLAAEVVRLHDPASGTQYDAKNNAHREIADFIIEQEQRIARMPAHERLRDGKMFLSRLHFQQLPLEDRDGYWFLGPDDVLVLLSQKYAYVAKKTRDEELDKFNKRAEKLGYKASKSAPNKTENNNKPAPKTSAPPPSPEAISQSSIRTTNPTPLKEPGDVANAIVGHLFPRIKSS